MNNLKLKFEVQNAVRSWLGYFMQENKVPASMVVDALNASLLELKDAAYVEMLAEVEAEFQKTQTKNEKEEE